MKWHCFVAVLLCIVPCLGTAHKEENEFTRHSPGTLQEILQAELWYGVPEEIDIKKVQRLLVAKALVNLSPKKHQPLSIASRRGRLDIVTLLLDAQADVERASGGCGDLPLQEAAAVGSIPVVDTLIGRRANVNKLNGQEQSALDVAVQKGQLEMVHHLIDAHQATLPMGLGREACLVHAAARDVKNIGALSNFLSCDINPNIPGFRDKRPLHVAAEHHNLQACEQLRHAGAFVDLRDIEGNTPLHYAADDHDNPTYDYLVQHGADERALNRRENTPHEIRQYHVSERLADVIYHAYSELASPQELALCEQKALGEVQALVQKGAVVNRPAHGYPGKGKRMQPLKLAAEYGFFSIVQWLLNNTDADVNIVSWPHGDRPLERSAKRADVRIAQLLMERKADLDGTNKCGDTALMTACRYANHAVVDLLLAAKASVHGQGEGGNSAVWLAAYYCNQGTVPILQKLLALRADPNVANRNGITPLRKAAEANNLAACKLLVEGQAIVDVAPAGSGWRDVREYLEAQKARQKSEEQKS